MSNHAFINAKCIILVEYNFKRYKYTRHQPQLHDHINYNPSLNVYIIYFNVKTVNFTLVSETPMLLLITAIVSSIFFIFSSSSTSLNRFSSSNTPLKDDDADESPFCGWFQECLSEFD